MFASYAHHLGNRILDLLLCRGHVLMRKHPNNDFFSSSTLSHYLTLQKNKNMLFALFISRDAMRIKKIRAGNLFLRVGIIHHFCLWQMKSNRTCMNLHDGFPKLLRFQFWLIISWYHYGMISIEHHETKLEWDPTKLNKRELTKPFNCANNAHFWC